MSNKKLNRLQELISQVDRLMDTSGNTIYNHNIEWLTDKNMKRKFYDDHPECFVSINVPGYNPAFLPICNKLALQDPKIVSLSMKLVRTLNRMGKCDRHTRDVVLAKLVRLQKRIDKEIPTPYKGSAKKAQLTKYMNNMKAKIDDLKKQQYQSK